ncbi:MAG: 4-alpha-glucanotransferase [Clostridiales bacterium]|jgi:4-alpha-glucanotransferase|nr:4-alpha-glucanotransferase [Clostridiales bacterium]
MKKRQKRISGVLNHPTSFPSRYGIGDLGKGARDFIDFLKAGGQSLWQVLPINPTSFGDSPYQSFSTFAGNHMLISPDELIAEGFLNPEDVADVPQFSAHKVEYGNVIEYKTGLLKKSYGLFLEKASQEQKNDFSDFCKKHESWLDNYCLFAAIKNHLIEQRKNEFESDEFKTFREKSIYRIGEGLTKDYYYGAAWLSWPDDIIRAGEDAVKAWKEKLADEVNFFRYTQYVFCKQWAEIKRYANEREIKIIGDIPIFVAMDSADVWANKNLFQLDEENWPVAVAGVPPDYFSATGQLWGNPLYAWKEHEKQDYDWWIKRISHMLEFVDILRIDHFRGFESYWRIPFGETTAIEGKWTKGPGEKLFKAIEAKLGKLPIIAEDLGVLTEAVENLRDQFNLPGMKILQFGFDGGESDNANMPHNIKTANVVIYTGTHDNDTTAGWYSKVDEKVRDQFRRYMNVSGDDVSWDMIRLAFLSAANYAVIPIQDIMGLGSYARINVPGVAVGNWQFRYSEDMLRPEMASGLLYLSKLSDRNLRKEFVDEEEISPEYIGEEI